jgi:hypothetical protein
MYGFFAMYGGAYTPLVIKSLTHLCRIAIIGIVIALPAKLNITINI